jgi:uncharacterized protein (DUF2384 family)
MAASPNIEFAGQQAEAAVVSTTDPILELANYKRLVSRVVDAFGDEQKASRWLSLPNADLHGETPLQSARKDSYLGELVEPILVRIEHGIYH